MTGTKEISVVNDMDDEVMSVIDLGVEDGRVFVYGRLMGSWESKMYISPEGVASAIQLALRHPELLGFAAKLPELIGEKQ